MEGVAWTAVELLGASVLASFGAFFYLGAKIDAQGAELGARIDAQGARLDARIGSLQARLDARLDTLTTRLDEHVLHHTG
ncbi:MAG: hypothetical protein ACXWYQ_07615 [Actinomycetota bacterium]